MLAESDISIIAQCAFIYDHIFVHANDLDKTVELLKEINILHAN